MRWRLGFLSAVIFLAVALAIAVRTAFLGGDWPEWDEGWVLIAFPLGIPVVLYAVFTLTADRRHASLTALGTLAVWLWGALLFLVWSIVG